MVIYELQRDVNNIESSIKELIELIDVLRRCLISVYNKALVSIKEVIGDVKSDISSMDKTLSNYQEKKE